MIEKKYLDKIKSIFSDKLEKSELTGKILYCIAVGEKIPLDTKGERKISQSIFGLRRYKFVRHVSGVSGGWKITAKGEKRLRNIAVESVEINKPRRWDGKWRMIMFDLPIRFKNARNAFRWRLKDMGFFQLQRSVWVYPYPCEKEMLFVADFFGVGEHVEILEVNHILHDQKLKDHFRLS